MSFLKSATPAQTAELIRRGCNEEPQPGEYIGTVMESEEGAEFWTYTAENQIEAQGNFYLTWPVIANVIENFV